MGKIMKKLYKKFTNKRKRKAQLNEPNGVCVRFLHWNNRKITGISYNKYFFRLSKLSKMLIKKYDLKEKVIKPVLEKYDLKNAIVLQIIDNDNKRKLVVVEKWINNIDKYKRKELKELNIVDKRFLTDNNVPKFLDYNDRNEMFKDVKKVVLSNNKKLKWVE